MGNNKKQVQLAIGEEDLVLIDQAASMAGESRSGYMVRAALERMGRKTEFTHAQYEEIRSIALDVLGEVSRIDWIVRGKADGES